MKLSDLRQAIVGAAEYLWKCNIHDDGGPVPEITSLFDAAGWGAWLRDPDGGGCPDGYTRPPDPDYCGHTWSMAALQAGYFWPGEECLSVSLDRSLAKHVVASTYRLNSREHWNKAGYEKPNPARPPVENVKPGDIVVVGTSKYYGDHIVIPVERPEGDTFKTIEGNATGTRADGTEGKGVIKRERKLSEVSRVWPLKTEFFTE